MFFDFLGKRTKPGGDTRAGAWNLHRSFRKKFDLILGESGPGKCLEIGPGEGIFAEHCARAGIDYAGIERNPALQSRLVAAGFDVTLGRAPPLEYADESFDLVVAMTVLEHMPTFEDAYRLVEESRRVLKEGGVLAVEVPDFLRAGIDYYAWDYTHSYLLTTYRLRQLLEDAGYEVLCVVSFAGSLTHPLLRFPVDLVGFLVHSRFVYWLAQQLSAETLVYKFHKTFEPSILALARKGRGRH